MKKKLIKRIDINSLGIKPKRLDIKRIFELVKKIGIPMDPPVSNYGSYNSA